MKLIRDYTAIALTVVAFLVACATVVCLAIGGHLLGNIKKLGGRLMTPGRVIGPSRQPGNLAQDREAAGDSQGLN